MPRAQSIKTYYSPKMTYSGHGLNTSKSPKKPGLMVEYINQSEFATHINIINEFKPFNKQDFYIAHHKEYVDSFFSDELKRRYRRMLGLTWDKELAESVRYTNASLYYAILNSIKTPKEISFSPTSGFHHATPKFGAFYCPFSGQVIASTKIYRDLGLSGAYIDLDAHHGNSIDNSYDFVPDLHLAIPLEIGNINIEGTNQNYLSNLKNELSRLKEWIHKKKIHYLVFCHGADSCEEDDMGYKLTRKEWLQCSTLFYTFVKELEKENITIPLTISLFGGYNKNDYNKVLDLHLEDLKIAFNILC